MKNIMITGATGDIGFAIATAAASKGWNLILQGRNSEKLEACRKNLTTINPNIHILQYDAQDREAIKQAFVSIKKKFGNIDILVNTIGKLDDGLLGMIDIDSMVKTFDVNVHSAIMHMQYASRLMIRNKKGSIINISSIMGVYGDIGQTVYSASKAAMNGATYAASKELAVHNIRVNAIAPGFIDTNMTRNLQPDIYNKRVESIKMGRVGQPEEVADLVIFLASDKSTYITGQVIGIDGGMVI